MKNMRVNVKGRLFIYSLPIIILLLYSLALVGCITTDVRQIFHVKLLTGATSPEVRVGYFGICVIDRSASSCKSTWRTSADEMRAKLFTNSSVVEPQDRPMTDLINVALQLQTRILGYLLLAAGFLFIIGLFVLALCMARLKSRKSETHSGARAAGATQKKFLLGLLWLAAITELVAALSILQAVNAMVFLTEQGASGNLRVVSGVALQGLQWAICGFSLMFAGGVTAILASSSDSVSSHKVSSGGGAFER
ncbi:MAG: hypothetical protein M1817_002299 [Caeruleum heppii]|nr:MAG: hypothetical protein M1817_003517 [Caeruleum heppii]KAI9673662.1 MAG: hypothetical protein M1817_002299 [Caeruleum heppii]